MTYAHRAAYYNEIDPFAAGWIDQLASAGHIAAGRTDRRSIVEVRPDDQQLQEHREAHFFAGIGIWARALAEAGWPTARASIWTGSCPCQPFSTAGRQRGFADERHLWPTWFALIDQCRPNVVLGEQVASRDGLAWLDAVQADLERSGYAVGAVDSCAAGYGAPHLRQRLYFAAVRRGWVADAGTSRRHRLGEARLHGRWEGAGGDDAAEGGTDGPCRDDAARCGEAGSVADAERDGRTGRLPRRPDPQRGVEYRPAGPGGATDRPGATNGYWRDADWLWCRDGRWRPARPGSFPLANGAANRVGRLRGYGNAIVLPQAKAWVEAVMGVLGLEAAP